MAVHTELSDLELKPLLDRYDLGKLITKTGITAGITNTIYRIKTNYGQYILVLFEELTREQLPFYIRLTDFLASANLPCARTIADREQNTIQVVRGKPAIICEYLIGDTLQQATPRHCAQVGKALATLHLRTMNYPERQENFRGEAWRDQTAMTLKGKLTESDWRLLQDELAFLRTQSMHNLPQGIIHADLFMDNVLFVKNQLTGLLDFYYACYGPLLYDLAITINAWCWQNQIGMDLENYNALVTAYRQHRTFTAAEIKQWPNVCRHAAMRFWLSRLYDFHVNVTNKDPKTYRAILAFHQSHALLL